MAELHEKALDDIDVYQILDFVPEDPTFVSIMPPGVHVRSTTSVLVISFWQGAGHGLRLDSSNEIGVP